MTEIYQPFQREMIDLDTWTREIISWHFQQETGSPYWLERLKQFDFNPLTDIKTYDDLKLFGFFNESELKTIPAQSLIPKGMNRNNRSHCRIFETGGTLGAPKRIIDLGYRRKVSKWLSYSLDLHGFPQGGNWLHLGPAGPHVVGHTTGELAQLRNGLCYYIDIDTRWIKTCVKNGSKDILDDYLEHVLSQAQCILETQEIAFIFTTPKLLQLLAERLDLSAIRGVACGGTHVSPDVHRLLRQEILPGIPLCIVYGNTIMGVAPQVPVTQDDNWMIKHYSCLPYFTLKVVDPENPDREVAYGEIGRIQICTLTQDYFIPNLLERDEGLRVEGNDLFSWDGVANVRPLKQMEEMTIEGVY